MTIRVLLADDHAVVRDGLRSLLERHSLIRVVGDAADGREAVRQVLELEPDVVVIDIAMPEMNGIEATAQILAQRPETRIIVLSMHSSREYIHRALKAGAHGYLLKESAGQEVVEAVLAVQAGRRYLSPAVADLVLADYLQSSQQERPDPLEALSVREREVLQLTVEGKTSAQIAQLLYLSPKTVDTYRSRVMRKLGVGDLPGLVKFAIRHGLTSLE